MLGEFAGAGLDVFVDAPPFLEDEETGGGVVFGEVGGVGEVEAGFGFAIGGGACEPAGFESAGNGRLRSGLLRLRLLRIVAVHGVFEILVVLVNSAVEFAFFAVFEASELGEGGDGGGGDEDGGKDVDVSHEGPSRRTGNLSVS